MEDSQHSILYQIVALIPQKSMFFVYRTAWMLPEQCFSLRKVHCSVFMSCSHGVIDFTYFNVLMLMSLYISRYLFFLDVLYIFLW